MAGAGYKLFNTGDVLTAQQVNEYLMQQTVMVFADASARTTALSGIVAEGMMSYLKDTNKTYRYDGSAWLDDAGTTSPLTTKGDVWTYSTTDARLASSGVNGNVLTVDTSTATGLKWAAPASTGVTWTQRVTDTGNAMRKIAYNGTNLYVAVGDAGTLYSSPDGITWTSRTSGFGANAINDVAFGNGLWVAVGANGTLTTSTDGTTWTSRTANMSTNTMRAVTYANSLWVAVGGGGGATNTGGITYSTDGLTWTRKSQSLTVGTTYYGVVWNGTNWIVVADLSTNDYLYASAPSGTWTAGNSSAASTNYDIFWDGTRHILLSDDRFYYSTNNQLGTVSSYGNTPSSNTNVLSSQPATLYNNKVYMTNGSFIQDFTPATAQYVNYSGAIIAPSRLTSTAVGVHTYCVWVGAVGYIVATSGGAIFTSF